MKNVQIAIRNREYAQALRHLLIGDGQHQVFILDRPTSEIDGVILVDEEFASDLRTFADSDLARCVAFTSKDGTAVKRLFEAGIRHAIQADCPLRDCRMAILNAERLIDDEWSEEAMDDELDSPMPQHELSEQIRDLRNAIAMAVWSSPEVAKAMSVFAALGREVQIEIDAVLINPEHPGEVAEAVAVVPASEPTFDASDQLFLQALKISDR